MCTQHSTIQYRPLLTFWLEVLVLRFSSLPPVSDYQERQTQHTRKGLPPCCSDTCIALATPTHCSPVPLTVHPPHSLFTRPTHCSPAPPTVHPPHPLFTRPTHCSPAPPTVHLPHPLFTRPTHCSPAPPTVHPPHPLFTCPTHLVPTMPGIHALQ